MLTEVDTMNAGTDTNYLASNQSLIALIFVVVVLFVVLFALAPSGGKKSKTD
jgi:hypothetical protein